MLESLTLLIYPSKAEIGSLENARGALSWSLIFSTAIVFIGVILENDTFSKYLQQTGWKILLVGLALEVVISAELWGVDTGISSILRSELIEVRSLTADRSLTPEERKSVIEALSAFPGQQSKVVIFPVNFESSFAADEIYGAMLNARWVVDPPEKLSKPPNDLLAQGVLIIPSDDSASLNAANKLFDALKSTGFSPLENRGKQPIPERNLFDHSKPLVWVLVGDKAAPLLDWVKP
jgi:hypothetical protein